MKVRFDFLACIAALSLTSAACNGPTITVSGQYLVNPGGPDLGVYLKAPSSPVPFLTGALGFFDPGAVDPNVLDAASGSWNVNHFQLNVTGGGGDIPTSVDGDAVDSSGDGIADVLNATVHLDTGETLPISIPRTDPFADYRCWNSLTGANRCIPVLGAADCAFVPSTPPDFDLTASIPFKDPDGNFNPGGTLTVSVVQHLTAGGTSTVTTDVPVPGTSGTWTLTASSSPDLVTLTGPVALDPAASFATVSFHVADAAGASSIDLQGEVACSTQIP